MQEQDTIFVIDFGGQYAHLIARRIRELGVYSEIVLPDVNIEKLKNAKGIILSGSPLSICDLDALDFNKEILLLGKPVMGMCYGHQIIGRELGGKIGRSSSKEFGTAKLKVLKKEGIFEGISNSTVWMSHHDEVSEVPNGFEIIGSTSDCKIAAMQNLEKKIFGFQFHPEVVHTEQGMKLFENFVKICGCKRTWSMKNFVREKIEEIKKRVGNRKVLLLASGGVDSTVALALLSKALGKEKIIALHVDHGFMRKNETANVQKALEKLGYAKLHVVNAEEKFLHALKGLTEPEDKRTIIGEMFLIVKDEEILRMNLNPKEWMLCQGTIYPDTIESARTKLADKIKTHHNRVEQIMELIEAGNLIEPLELLYKDEVRAVGRALGLPEKIVQRQPFPGPGLAIRTLCSRGKQEKEGEKNFKEIEKKAESWFKGFENIEKKAEKVLKKKYFCKMLPLKTVGVQGDLRTYRHCIALSGKMDWNELDKASTELTNAFNEINRVVYSVSPEKIESIELVEKYLTTERLSVVREADDIVMQTVKENNLLEKIWQFPVILLPLKVNGQSEAIVLRPVESTEAMTARFYRIEKKLLKEIAGKLLKVKGVSAVFFDITNKPPATIEWE